MREISTKSAVYKNTSAPNFFLVTFTDILSLFSNVEWKFTQIYWEYKTLFLLTYPL